MSGGKGGSQTTQVEIPQWLQTAAQQNLAQGKQVSRIGYVPYYGPDVAGLGQGQIAAAANTNQFAKAFGMQGAAPSSLGAPAEFAGGLQGYSSGGLYDQALAELKARRPLQYAQLTSPTFFNATGEGTTTVTEKPKTPTNTTGEQVDPTNPAAPVYVNPGDPSSTDYPIYNSNSTITFFNGIAYDLADPAQLEAYMIATGSITNNGGFENQETIPNDQPDSNPAPPTMTAQGLLSTMKGMSDWKTMTPQQKIAKYVEGAKLNNIPAEEIASATGYDINTVLKYM